MFANIIDAAGREAGNIWYIFLILGLFAGFLKWAWTQVKKELEEVIDAKTEPMRAEMKPNGGGSLRDQVNVLVAGQNEFRGDMGHVKTKLNQMDADSQLDRARLKATIANHEAAFYETDENDTVTYVNDEYLSLFGLSYHDAMANDWDKVVDPDDLDDLRRSVGFAYTNQVEWTDQFRIIRPTDKKKFLLTVRAFPIKVEGVFKGFVGGITKTKELV